MPKNLNYIILKPRQNITLNIFEAEKYEPAIIVQQLVGNLIYYSNKGRYEPRLAEKWEILPDNKWSFKLKKNIKCENNEYITPENFKKSLDRSIFIYSKMGGIPVLNNLVGYSKFLKENINNKNINALTALAGIKFDADNIIFEFDKKVKSGLLQILSFSPFGYICKNNFSENGEWANDSAFISSGPYKLEDIEVGKKYILTKNSNWPDFEKNAPDRIIFSHDDTIIDAKNATIVDAFTNEYQTKKLEQYTLVPEYLNSILLGNYEHGYFSKLKNREYIRFIINKSSIEVLPVDFGTNKRSSSFYPNQEVHIVDNLEILEYEKPSQPLIIEGTIPEEGTARWYSWLVLKNAFEKNFISYKFAKNQSSFSEITSKKYDIRLRGSSIGGGVEAWGLYVSFCTAMGINFPDPSNRICDLINDYDADKINDQELTENFFKFVKEDSAILPISHYGVNLFVSPQIELKSISPLMSIIRLDQINLE